MYHVSFDIELLKNQYPGKLVVLEGIDAAGKTTQGHEIVDHLSKLGKKAVFTKEPTDHEVGRLIRDVLQGKLKMPLVSFQYLFAADRQIHQEEIIDFLKQGITVVSDRYFWSGVAYGMATKEDITDRDLVAQSILSMYHQFILPDQTFYLEVSPNTAIERLSKMHKVKELYEKKDRLTKIHRGYEWLVKKFPKEIISINGEKNVREVTKEILSKL